MKTALLIFVVGGTMLAASAGQRGTAAASAGMHVNGNAVPATGAKTWPVMAGDEIKATSAPVHLTLKDGSKILLGANSAAKFETTAEGSESVRLVNGSMRYQMSTDARTQLVVNNRPLVVVPGATGTVGNQAVGSMPVLGQDLATAKPAELSGVPIRRRK